jgi:RimJ/RimL family protein N-acetyltransferase
VRDVVFCGRSHTNSNDWVVAENVAARRVYAKVGFVEEGRSREAFRRDGKWHDMILMGLLEHELLP